MSAEKIEEVFVADCSAITALGNSVAMIAASIASGISAYQDSQYFNKKDKPIKMALVPNEALPELSKEIDESARLRGDQRRMLQLAHAGLDSMRDVIEKKTPITLFLAGPEKIPGRETAISSNFLKYLGIQCEVDFNTSTSTFIAGGRAGVLTCLQMAIDHFNVSDDEFVLVGGVDTPCHLSLLSHLDSQDRLLAVNIMDGTALGEGAGFLLLSRKQSSACKPVTLAKPGADFEKGHRYNNDAPHLGDGLSKAVARALAHDSEMALDAIYSSMNGELFFAKEHGIMFIRHKHRWSHQCPTIHPADCYGDIGAATGALLVALSTHAMQSRFEKTHHHLICCSNDTARRAALYVRSNAPNER